jgi:hypothetical protein
MRDAKKTAATRFYCTTASKIRIHDDCRSKNFPNTLTVVFLADTIERGDTRTVVVGVRSLLLRRGGSPAGGLLPSRVDTMVLSNCGQCRNKQDPSHRSLSL